MKCPLHNLEMHYHPPTDRHACQVPRCKYAEGVTERSIDPFERSKLIRAGELDEQMPDYDELTGWLQRMPKTWLAGFTLQAIESATIKKVFLNKAAALSAFGRGIDGAGNPHR